MKKLFFAILIISISASVINAQSDSENNEYYNKAFEQYLVCLSHHNDGVVESTIIILMKIRREYPDLSYQTTIDTLKEMASNGRTSNIRSLAFIAGKYLQNPEDPNIFADIRIENDEQLITMLLDRIE